jgi:hypothetical protein
MGCEVPKKGSIFLFNRPAIKFENFVSSKKVMIVLLDKVEINFNCFF